MLAAGCTIQIDFPDNGNDNGGTPGNGGGGTGGTLRVAFDAQGGNLAAGVDDAGRQYAFRAREESGGRMKLTEANVQLPDGMVLKASLDGEGRPVNLRAADNTAADLVYEGDVVRVRLTAPDGSVIADEAGLDAVAARQHVRNKRATVLQRESGFESRQFVSVDLLSNGLSVYAEVAFSLFDDDFNPGSPLVRSSLARPALSLGAVSTSLVLVEVERSTLGAAVVIDQTPAILRTLAGQTYVLYDADGFCLEETGIASRLTFDNDGILLSEFDRRLVIPTLGFGGGGDRGVTVNYLSGTPINLAPDAIGSQLFVTPIFVGTQVDAAGNIAVERRFRADFSSGGSIGGTLSTTLFDAAFVNGRLFQSGDYLEFDLSLIDLASAGATVRTGRLRYHNQNASRPPLVSGCTLLTGARELSGLLCPQFVDERSIFHVAYVPGRDDLNRPLTFDWFVSNGFGVVWGDSFAPETDILAVADGFLEVTLVVSDATATSRVPGVYTCGVSVGRTASAPPVFDELILQCPGALNVGETGVVSASGSLTRTLDEFYWYVFGTSDFAFDSPSSLVSGVTFYRPGRFEVGFQGFDFFGDEVYAACEIRVGGIVADECERNGYYGDGICDEFCLRRDPDCDVFFDICAVNGWYDDGVCDDFCPLPDVDCEIFSDDVCEEFGFYGDGVCDLSCAFPDPDCDLFFDICEENDWYDDGFCDEDCAFPDPDCF